MPRAESPLPFFDASAQAGIFSVGPVPQYTSGDGSRDVLPPPPPPFLDVAGDASGGNSVYVPAPPPPPRSPDIAVDTTTDAPGADPAVRRPCTCRACARASADARAVCLCAPEHARGHHVVARQAHPPQVWRVRCVHGHDLRLQYEHTQVLHRVRGTCLLHVASVSCV
jgi:hypothetical protein